MPLSPLPRDPFSLNVFPVPLLAGPYLLSVHAMCALMILVFFWGGVSCMGTALPDACLSARASSDGSVAVCLNAF